MGIEKSENLNRPATLAGGITHGVVYTFRQLVSSTKDAPVCLTKLRKMPLKDPSFS